MKKELYEGVLKENRIWSGKSTLLPLLVRLLPASWCVEVIMGIIPWESGFCDNPRNSGVNERVKLKFSHFCSSMVASHTGSIWCLLSVLSLFHSVSLCWTLFFPLYLTAINFSRMFALLTPLTLTWTGEEGGGRNFY